MRVLGPVGEYKRGAMIEGRTLKVRHTFQLFSPLALHKPLAFSGLRFSLVFFLPNLRKGSNQTAFNEGKIRSFLNMGFPAEGLIALGLVNRLPSCIAMTGAKRPRSSEDDSKQESHRNRVIRLVMEEFADEPP